MNAKLCTICQTRPVPALQTRRNAGMSRDMEYCLPCYEEAGWENAHADGHDAETTDPNCWICNPELNKAQQEYTPRVGTSRAGMEITVPIRAAGQTKAIVIGCRISGIEIEAGTTEGAAIKALRSAGISIVTRKGISTLKTGDARLVWDEQGRFDYDASSLGEKKLRNAAAYLRALSA